MNYISEILVKRRLTASQLSTILMNTKIMPSAPKRFFLCMIETFALNRSPDYVYSLGIESLTSSTSVSGARDLNDVRVDRKLSVTRAHAHTTNQ